MDRSLNPRVLGMTLNYLKGFIMDERKCTICGDVNVIALRPTFNDRNAYTCEYHKKIIRKYVEENHEEKTEYGIPLTVEENHEMMVTLIQRHISQQMRALRQNAEDMNNVMNSWQNGCLSNSEVINKILVLSDETFKIAWNLEGHD